MKDFILTCCSTADMPKEYFEERKIPYACFHYTLEDKQYSDDLGESMPFEEYYKKISEGAMPITSQVNVGEFIDFFEQYLKEGKDILHISFSSGLSGSCRSATMARTELLEKYPERKILIVDSLGASSGYGMLVDAVADMRDAGKEIDEIYSWAEENKLKIHHWFFSTDLTHYKRGGRISAASAIFGTILNICPLMNMDENGKLIPREKVRGKQKVVERITDMMESNADGGIEYSGKCFISHSACYDDARKVADKIEERFKNLCGKVMINSVGTVIGAHTGPGTVALYFFGNKRQA